MGDKRVFKIEHSNPRWRHVLEAAISAVREWAESGDLMISLSDIRRTLDQNAAMWPALRDFAKQVAWSVTLRDGSTIRADAEDIKDIMTSAFEQETRMAPGLRGGFVMLGARTSNYGKQKFGDFLTFLRAEGDDRGVQWSAPARENFERYIPQERVA